MKPQKLVFVELSKGQMEDVSYNNVALSNGIRTASVKNLTAQDDYIKTLKEGDAVVCEFEASIVKGPNKTTRFDLTLVKIEKVK